MSKVKIKIVSIGYLPKTFKKRKILKWKSSLFEIDQEIEDYALRGNGDHEWRFNDDFIRQAIPKEFSADFRIALTSVPLQDNWYSRRIGNNTVVATFDEINNYLFQENIPLENFILRLLYAYSLVYKSQTKIPPIEDYRRITHDETRGCLFDMNGNNKADITYSCDQPIICDECEERLKKAQVPNLSIKEAKNEIKRIKKEPYYMALTFIKKHPLFALLISSIFAVVLGTIASLMASWLYAKMTGGV